MTATEPGTRLSRATRREQLLDVAAELVTSNRSGAITMEGLAAAAGVSKALPYAHFDNAEHVLADLYQRELAQFGARVLAAVADAPPGEPSLDAAIATYFDVIAERGAILGVVAGATRTGEEPDPDLAPNFVGDLLVANFTIGRPEAVRLGALILGVLDNATALWARGAARRRAVQASATGFIIAGVRAVAEPR